MSKLLAMMMKPKPIMYATIKGSLTENNGIFSGFSSSNYLELQNTITLSKDSNIEIIEKINKPSNKGSNSFVGTISRHGFVVQGTNNGNITVFIGNGNSWSVTGDSGRTGTVVLNNDTEYYIKIKIANGVFNVLYSTDNINYISDISVDISSLTTEQQYTLGFGIARLSTSYFTGSIDLNRSYIKIDNTKYKLQAVVGYEQVGSPTITDGVVSGFSSSDYLKIENFPKNVNFSGKVRAKLNTENSGFCSLFRFQRTSPNDRFSVENNNVSIVRIYHYNETTSSNASNSIYSLTLGGVWVDYIFDYDRVAKTVSIKAINVNDNSTLFDETYNNCVLDNTDYVQFGYMFQAWNGEIDMNETYIKINNKLWFNGQPA